MGTLLVDVHALMHRSYNGLPKLTDGGGHPTGATYGFLRALFAQLKTGLYDRVVCVYDAGSSARKGESSTYKSNRNPQDEDLKTQIKDILEILPELGIPTMGLPGYEADDILYTICQGQGGRIDSEPITHYTIFTCDNDLLHSLHSSVDVLLFNTSQKKIKRVTKESFIEEHGEAHYQNWILIKSMVGDKSDNIPGIPGVGVKMALKILEECGSSSVLEHPKVKEHAELVKENVKLIRPRLVEEFYLLDESEMVLRKSSLENYKQVMMGYGFKTLANEKYYSLLPC